MFADSHCHLNYEGLAEDQAGVLARARAAGVEAMLNISTRRSEWDEVIAVNLTANWHLIRHMDALLRKSDAGRAVFLTSGAAANPRAYRGLYATSKAGLEALARVYADETKSTAVRVNIFNPGPTRTKMRAAVMPGEDPMTLPTPDVVAATIVPLCLPTFTETGKLYDFRAGKLMSFHPPA